MLGFTGLFSDMRIGYKVAYTLSEKCGRIVPLVLQQLGESLGEYLQGTTLYLITPKGAY